MSKSEAHSTHDSPYFKICDYARFIQVFWKKAVTPLDKVFFVKLQGVSFLQHK